MKATWLVSSILGCVFALGIIGCETDAYIDDDEYDLEERGASLGGGEKIKGLQYLSSPNGTYKFGMSSGGDLELVKGSKRLWSAKTCCTSSNYAKMQSDGNLVVRNSSGKALWSSRTAGKSGATLTVENDGKAVIRYKNSIVWSVGGDSSSSDSGSSGDSGGSSGDSGSTAVKSNLQVKLAGKWKGVCCNSGELEVSSGSCKWSEKDRVLSTKDLRTGSVTKLDCPENSQRPADCRCSSSGERMHGIKANGNVHVRNSLKLSNGAPIYPNSGHETCVDLVSGKLQSRWTSSTCPNWRLVNFY